MGGEGSSALNPHLWCLVTTESQAITNLGQNLQHEDLLRHLALATGERQHKEIVEEHGQLVLQEESSQSFPNQVDKIFIRNCKRRPRRQPGR